MNRRIALLSLGLIILGRAAFAQAPASIAGYTLRANYNTGPFVITYENIVVVFSADGTYQARLEAQNNLGQRVNYLRPQSGTYRYTTTSNNSASLIATPAIAPYIDTTRLTFSSSSQGSMPVTAGQAPAPASFSLLPTGGNAPDRALVNVSLLYHATQGQPLTLGFVVGGPISREILIRAVGPSLAAYGVSDFAPNPQYTLNSDPSLLSLPGETIAYPLHTGLGWSATDPSTATITAANIAAGAFPLTAGSSDKADLTLLRPGNYTITVNPTDASQAGAVLLEIYEIE